MISYRSLSLAAGAALLALAASAAGAGRSPAWLYFGHDPARTDVVTGPTGVTRASLHRLRRRVVRLPGTVDSSPAYVPHLGGHDLLLVTTSFGRTLALDARSGRTLWRYVPPGIRRFEHSGEITEASPVADPARGAVYAATPDGTIHKLALADGHELRTGAWPVAVTRQPGHEKLSSSLGVSGQLVFATTSSFLDKPPYEGHLVTIDADTGAIVGVFNSECSDLHALPDAGGCPVSGGSIWGRPGAVVEPGSGDLLLATANGPWNGRDQWGESVVELSPDGGTLLRSWTDARWAHLNAGDRDIGSISPALLDFRGRRLFVQGGKDGVLRLVDLDALRLGTVGGELQRLRGPDANGFYNQPAVLQRGGTSIAFIANHGATAAYVVRGPRPHLAPLWRASTSGTSPVLAGGLLYVFDPDRGRLDVRVPLTGRLLASLPAAHGHWNSPIVADGRIVLPEGGANELRRTGQLVIWSVPGR